MREIKFRAWNRSASRMSKSFTLVEFYQTEGIQLIRSDITLNNPDKFLNLVIMQYTGLKDKNGKEIYEGDIVRYNNRACEIFCKGASFGFWSDKRGYGEFCTGSTGIEIIGNIHGTPELIK